MQKRSREEIPGVGGANAGDESLARRSTKAYSNRSDTVARIIKFYSL